MYLVMVHMLLISENHKKKEKQNGGMILEDRGEPIMYTCYACSKNFQSKICPNCGKKGSPIYKDQTYKRPANNPTDINAFFKNKGK